MEGDGLLIFLTRFNSQFIKVFNSLGERALMFFARGGKFYEWYGPSVGGRRIRQELVLIVHKEGRHEGRDTERRILGAALQLYDADGLCDHCWGWGRLTYDIGHTLIYNLTE